MRRIGSAALIGLLPLLGLVPAISLAQGQVYQPTPPPGAAPAPDVVQPPSPGMAPAMAPGGAPGMAAPASLYSPQQLDQMLAPIALYPDSLLTQILMASTYPTEIVEAAGWLQNPSNAAIRGDMLVAVLTPIQWDPSVKSLVPFPQILRQLNDNLDWTQSLGTAFAGQQADVMARIQVLRGQAAANGTLASNPQIRVLHEGGAWIIEPANPAVVYVPVYNPTLVYGRWAYVDYPPVYFAPEPGFFVGDVGVGIGYSVGFGVVGPLWGWGHPSWDGGTVVVNNAYYSRISYNHSSFAGGSWRHEGGVNLVHGAGFHGPGGPAFRPGPGGFHGAGPAGFHGPGPAGGFHGGPAAGGFHGGPAAGGGGFHGPTTSGGYHAPGGGGVSHPQPAGAHGPAGGGFHPPGGGGVSHPQPAAARGPAGGGFHPPGGGGVSRPQPAAGGFHPPGGGGGMTHPQPAAHAPAPSHSAPSGGKHH